jgi:cephalosporin-C deacetylase-like acetyl esterase
VDVLLARADVDPARLGALGISYGGASGALFAGVERRVAAYALAVATAAWPSTSATRRACRTRRPTA